MKTFKVLSIDAWAEGQTCPNCGSTKVQEQVTKPGMKCDSCLEVFDENEGISWTWNNWFNAGTYNEEEDGPLTEENALKFFFKEWLLDYETLDNFKAAFEIEDDQHNLVIVKKSNRMPLNAIEYGNY